MKKLLIISALLIAGIYGCKNGKKDNNNGDGGKNVTDITPRDRTINEQNAYNNLFIDSNKVEAFIASAKVGDTTAIAIRNFYNARNYQFAWFSSTGLTEQALGFRTLYKYDDTTAHNKKLEAALDELMNEDSSVMVATDASTINMELELTNRFVRYTLGEFKDSRINARELERFVPAKKQTVAAAVDSLLKDKDNKNYASINSAYKGIKDQVIKYAAIQKAGGWQPIPEAKKSYKAGVTDPAILAVKKRLSVVGLYDTKDTSATYTPELEAAIKKLQPTLGFDADGVIDDGLIKVLNVPVKDRIKQLLLNMERMRWMPDVTEGKLAMVNIPAFYLTMYEGKDTAFTMRVVVGKEGHNTTMFYGEMNQVVFSPYWNIPTSIVKKEILPGIARNSNYLAAHNMEKTASGGYRQKPGGNNSLGRVKFLFPNSFSIYFHDTPSKGLFLRENRAYSHGCIRLQDPVKMANYVLKGYSEWTPEAIEEAMNKEEEKFVKVKEPIPVIIAYYTSWIGLDGALNFRNDIYAHDADMAKKMFVD